MPGAMRDCRPADAARRDEDMRPALQYHRACWASTYRFCVAQPCPRLYEAFHLERVTALSGRQKSGAHVYFLGERKPLDRKSR